MIKTLEIKNFKSIKNLKLNCKRINVFIGEPNTGKSNILEAIGVLSHLWHRGTFSDFVRFENMIDLFYDQNLERDIEFNIDGRLLKIEFKNGLFYFHYKIKEKWHLIGSCNYFGDISFSLLHTDFKQYKFYRFKILNEFENQQMEYLYPPSGNNLYVLLLGRNQLKKTISQLVDQYGLKTVLDRRENKIKIQKDVEGIIISYPYSLLSDTLQRIIFHIVAIETNENSIIAFEEPEAHAFPYHTKFLAERIALDRKKNQYFISTHNPYFLLSLLEKSPKEDIAIFLTYFEDYQTKVKELNDGKKRAILDMEADVFFNIEKLLEG